MISLFQLSISHSYAAIFQKHERMRLTFHNSSVILGVVPNRVILDIPQLLTQKLLNKTTLLLGLNHRYKG